MSVDTKTVARIAHLARIRVADGDLDYLAGELNKILGFVEQLNEVDVTGVEPMTSVVAAQLSRRADVVTDGGIAERVLANAPAAEHGYFGVPKVIE